MTTLAATSNYHRTYRIYDYIGFIWRFYQYIFFIFCLWRFVIYALSLFILLNLSFGESISDSEARQLLGGGIDLSIDIGDAHGLFIFHRKPLQRREPAKFKNKVLNSFGSATLKMI